MRKLAAALALAAFPVLASVHGAEAKSGAYAHMMVLETQTGATVRYRVMKIGGRMMVLVPLSDVDSVFKRRRN